MLRLLRLVGIVVFAALVVFSASRLQQLYQDGKLFEQYNSQRKANVTVLVASVLSLGTLVFFELMRVRSRRSRQRSFGSGRSGQKNVAGVPNSTSIYSAPPTVDAWKGRRMHASRSRHKKTFI